MLWDIKQKLRSINSKILPKIPQLFDSSNMKIIVSTFYTKSEDFKMNTIYFHIHRIYSLVTDTDFLP